MIPGTPGAALLSRLYDTLAASDPVQKSDVILVLAGRECRKHFALGLLGEGWAPTLMLSVGRFEIRRFSSLDLPTSLDLVAIASATEPPRRHYFVTIEGGKAEAQRIAVGRFGTLSEILALSEWLKTHPLIRSVTVVSSGYHLKRIRVCSRLLVPEDRRLQFVAVPDENRYLREHWWRDPDVRWVVLSEVLKIAVYRFLALRLLLRSEYRPTLGQRFSDKAG